MPRRDVVIRFAGEGGEGVVTAAEFLGRAAATVGYHVQTFVTFPSQIMGGPTYSQVRISTKPVLSAGDDLDVLVALNLEAYEEHHQELRDGGVIIFDSAFEIPADRHSVGLPLDELAKQAGESRSKNMVLLGAIASVMNMPEEYLRQFISSRFRGRDAVIQANIIALRLGRERVANTGLRIGELGDPTKPEQEQVYIKGNDALALGAIHAGLDFYIGYPISPATSILVYMERNLTGPGKFAYQSSSEIESINGLLGAGFAGKKAMTATAGPGFSLMSEGLGLAWIAEIPCVVVDVQRGGPATGLPTKTEQSDLFAALSPAHGDARMPVIAPGTVEECFSGAINALNWAERYQGPVVVLSEHMLSERTQNITTPDLSKFVIESRQVYTGQNGYRRYEAQALSPMPIPGNPGAYVANGSEHDPMGDTTHRPSHHIHMTERRFGKLELLTDGTYERENSQHSVALLPWGGSKGPAQEAYEQLASHYPLAWYYTTQLHPLPPALLNELRRKDLVIVPELNYQGQFSSVLRSLGVKAESITQYTGLPLKVRDLAKDIPQMAKRYFKQAVTA